MAKFSVFKDQESLFACPICQAPMHLDLSSLVCQNRHTFNIAKQGFVNAQFAQHLIAPLAFADIHQLHAGGIAYFGGKFTRQHISYIILG